MMIRFLSLTMLLLASPALAADSARRDDLSLQLGAFGSGTRIRLTGEDDATSGGSMLGVRYLHRLDSKISIGLQGSALNPGSHTSTVLVPNGSTTSKFTSTVFLGVLRAHFLEGNLHPYFLGGLGLHSTHMKIDVGPRTGFVWTDTGTSESRTVVDSRRTGIAATLEGGLDYRMGEGASMGLFLAWYHMAKATYDATTAGRNGGISAISGNLNGVSLGASMSAHF